jgi:hypothetical protein
MHSLELVDGGTIDHNVFPLIVTVLHYVGGGSLITNNIIIHNSIYISDRFSNNMTTGDIGDNTVIVENWDDVFVGPNNGVTPTSNFKLKGTLGKNAGTDGTDVGIYGGSGFSDLALPPGPRIVRKVIADQTDENGNLRVQIEVKVGE